MPQFTIIEFVLETPHTIVAASIAIKTGNPYLAIPLCFLSHFVLDEIPHWNPNITTKKRGVKIVDPKSFKIILSDSLVALISGLIIAALVLPDMNKAILVILCCFIAVLPDVVEAPYIFLNYKKKWLRSWLFFQKKHQFKANFIWGMTTQFITIAAAVWWMVQK